eukprot:6185850-Pleurochrysis_carterae.AAC.3
MAAAANVVQSGACTAPRRPPWRSGIPSPRSRHGRAQRSRRRRERRSHVHRLQQVGPRYIKTKQVKDAARAVRGLGVGGIYESSAISSTHLKTDRLDRDNHFLKERYCVAKCCRQKHKWSKHLHCRLSEF